MDPLQAIILVVLCILILLEVRLPPSFRKIGMGPLVILGVVVLGYLFMTSPVLGIVGVIALYSLVQPVDQPMEPVVQDECVEESAPTFKDTLEEEMVKHVPGNQFN